MFDLFVNGQLVAIVAESVVKLFMNSLIGALPAEIEIVSRRHAETPQTAPAPEVAEEEKAE